MQNRPATPAATPATPHVLVAALADPRCYPHPVTRFECVETHASWILLTGDHAYKIKKPVDFGFLDYSTLEKRRRACEEELRLNRLIAPELYLDVVPVTGPTHAPRISGAGEALEYALHMRQFDRAQQLDRRLEAGTVDENDMDEVADYVAEFHLAAPRADPAGPYGLPEEIHAKARDNFTALAPRLDERRGAGLAALQTWSETAYCRNVALMNMRREQGWVRECHGDLHLGNLAWIHGRLTAFDRIEFDPALRWLDVLNDFAFLFMDLVFSGHRALAFHALNRYLQHTGDYRGLPLLRYYAVYRALVRAKVTLLKADQSSVREDRANLQEQAARYVGLAETLAHEVAPRLVLMHGLSGSGKTWLSEKLMSQLPAIRLRSDVERKRLHGLAPQQRSGSAPGAHIYARAASERTYRELAALAESVLAAGYTVIVDAAFLYKWQRSLFRKLAARLGVAWAIIDCEVPQATLRERLRARARAQGEISEADTEVLDLQMRTQEPLDADECARAVTVDAQRPLDTAAVIAAMRQISAGR